MMTKGAVAIVTCLVLGATAGCGGTWSRSVPVPENLYSYDGYRTLEVVPVEEFSRPSFNVSRNASGSKIIVTVEDHMLVPPAEQQRPAVYVLDAAGGLVAKRVQVPDEAATAQFWLDDKAEVFAWRTPGGLYKRPSGKDDGREVWAVGPGGIRFADGAHYTVWDARVGFCDGGRFMHVYDFAQRKTRVYELPELEAPVIEFDATGPPIRVFSTPTRLLIFGGATNNPKWADRAPKDAMWGLQIFEVENGAFVEREALPFPTYGYLVDVDPRSNLILVRRDRDLPFPHEYYLQDIETRKITRLGPITRATFMFLSEDILGEDRLAPFRKRW